MPSPYEWSSEMESVIRQQINHLVADDPRTDWNDGVTLGYPFDIIRNEVLKKGLTDFSLGHRSKEHGDLTPDEVALLYCYVNLKRHFFACLATYETHEIQIKERFRAETPPLILDFGCGPGTAFLALADLYRGTTFRYIGIDSAPAMRNKAQALWQAGQKYGSIEKGSICEFLPTWNDIPLTRILPETPLLLVFSYFFASHALKMRDLQVLARCVDRLAKQCQNMPLAMIYVNSTNELANRNYEIFKKEFGLDPDAHPPASLSIQFRKRKGVLWPLRRASSINSFA